MKFRSRKAKALPLFSQSLVLGQGLQVQAQACYSSSSVVDSRHELEKVTRLKINAGYVQEFEAQAFFPSSALFEAKFSKLGFCFRSLEGLL